MITRAIPRQSTPQVTPHRAIVSALAIALSDFCRDSRAIKLRYITLGCPSPWLLRYHWFADPWNLAKSNRRRAGVLAGPGTRPYYSRHSQQPHCTLCSLQLTLLSWPPHFAFSHLISCNSYFTLQPTSLQNGAWTAHHSSWRRPSGMGP